jgi:hypothetical protein
MCQYLATPEPCVHNCTMMSRAPDPVNLVKPTYPLPTLRLTRLPEHHLEEGLCTRQGTWRVRAMFSGSVNARTMNRAERLELEIA